MAFARSTKQKTKSVDDEFVPEITRSSDTRKKFAEGKTGNSSFSRKTPPSEPGVITRTSDKKSLYKRPEPGAPREKPAQSCKAYAGWLLSRRDYSAGVLRNKLVLRGYDAQEADEAMAFLILNNYQSDERYAHSLAQSLARRAGNRRLLMTMGQKKLDPAIAAGQLEHIAPESERVLLVVEKFRKDVAVDGLGTKLQQKIYRFLAYRGFSGDSIKIAMKFLASVERLPE